ncbi:MAG TPA: long-chain-fatty-acid--CoA ligase [Blastocatellia bacterium]|nr:long-chain-fatty-acid--CoA ligase [Blastocatellia bacterium]
MILSHVLERSARIYPNAIATICGEHSYTYSELKDRVHRLAKAFQQHGIRQGERVGMLQLNCHRFVEVVFACFEIGAVIVPMNTRLAADELSFIIKDSECGALVVDEMLTPLVDSIRPRLEATQLYISGGREGYVEYEELIASSTPTPEIAEPNENDIAGLFYTSGTTGIPKGVMLSHRNVWMNALHSIISLEIRPCETNLHVAPLFHVAGFPIILTAALSGGTHVFLKKFDPRAVLETIDRHQVTACLLVPTMINYVVNYPELSQFNLSSLKRIFYGASPIPSQLLKKAMEAMPECAFIQGYGQTESGPLLTVLQWSDHQSDGSETGNRRLTSCGRPILGVRVEVFNEQNQPVKPGEVGEIVGRGPNIMMGYWKRPDDSAFALRDGWLHTGDLATVDDEGYIYIVDRNKDMIVTGGENVYSTEVENVIYTHPAVREATVIGVPDSKWGEAVKAVVSLKSGRTLDEKELIAHCSARLAGYKVPKSVDFMDDLPKSGTGKILKKVLRDEYWKGQERKVN